MLLQILLLLQIPLLLLVYFNNKYYYYYYYRQYLTTVQDRWRVPLEVGAGLPLEQLVREWEELTQQTTHQHTCAEEETKGKGKIEMILPNKSEAHKRQQQ